MVLMIIGGLDGLRNGLGFTWRQNGCKNVLKIDPGGCAGMILGCVRVAWRVFGSDFGVCARRAASRAGLGFNFERRRAVLGSSGVDLF